MVRVCQDSPAFPPVRSGPIMFRPAILRNYEFHGRRGAAAAPEHRASGRPCQSEPNLPGFAITCGLFWTLSPTRAVRRVRRMQAGHRFHESTGTGTGKVNAHLAQVSVSLFPKTAADGRFALQSNRCRNGKRELSGGVVRLHSKHQENERRKGRATFMAGNGWQGADDRDPCSLLAPA